jgi:hypothetical protein
MITNRPARNLRRPTTGHPAADEHGAKVARAVARYAVQLTAMMVGPIEWNKIDTRDQRVLTSAGLIERTGEHRQLIALTAAGRELAARL